MSAAAVEWVLVIRFGPTAHRAVYGRFAGSNLYSKDYIQLSRKKEFIDDLVSAFPALQGDAISAPIVYSWPSGDAQGMLQKKSADRPHLAWATNNPPPPWRMSENPTSSTVETIKGNPHRKNEGAAEIEFEQLISSDMGQPFLVAVKLKGESSKLHLRVYIDDPRPEFEWADLQTTPTEIQKLAAATSNFSALAWRLFEKDDTPALYFDPARKNNSWSDQPSPFSAGEQNGAAPQASMAGATSSAHDLDSDSAAESLDHSETEVAQFEHSIDQGNYHVPDATATVKTRGSAQRAFSSKIKSNYNWRCAATGIEKPEFLIASHIVPWSVDETIRLDPSNGICLSVLADRAFEHGYITIQDDLTITVAWALVGSDNKLAKQLSPLDGAKLNAPKDHPPKVEYLKRRRILHP